MTNPQAFTTEALKVSFLCVDSTDEHETGDPETWTNKVTIKHKVHTAPDGTKRVELKAVPKVPVRYTTDGSNPRTAGGVYDGPIEISEGTQVVQAVPDGDGIVAEPRTIRIDWDDKAGFDLDEQQPATWQKTQENTTTQGTYAFLDRMKKHEVRAKGPRVTVNGEAWVELATDPDMEMSGERLEEVVDYVRGLIDEGEVSLSVDALRFETGQRLADWTEDAKVDLDPEEVQQ